MDSPVDPDVRVRKGRGATLNASSGRFALPTREADGDWRDQAMLVDGTDRPVRTEVTIEHPRTILTMNQSPDVPFDRSVNAYRGCEHGCIYCFARPTHAYLDLSPGLDFETKLYAKPDAAKLLRATMARPGYRPLPIAIGTNTDPYQPIEARYRITRAILELCLETRHPIAITTKSARVLDDLDLIAALARDGLTAVAISVTTLDAALARTLEPRASAPHRRLDAVGRLAAAGVPTHVNIAPVIPAINDHEIERIAAVVAEHGAHNIAAIPLRLPHEVAPLFSAWLAAHFPERAARVMAIVRQMRGGRANDPDFFTRMKGTGPWADLLANRIRIARQRYGMTGATWALVTDRFRPPAADGQLQLI